MTQETYESKIVIARDFISGIDKQLKKNKDQSEIAKLKEKRSQAVHKLSSIRIQYIENNQPCEIDQEVEIIDFFGRKLTGKAKAFAIMEDGKVYVTTYLSGNNTKHLSRPHKSLKVIN